MAEKQQKKKKGRSVQELLGIRTFTKYGLAVGKYELLFLSRSAHQYFGAFSYEYRDQDPPSDDGALGHSGH